MPASLHPISESPPKEVTPPPSAAVAAHHEAIKAELEAQIADLKVQIAELRADRRSVRDSWRKICFAQGDRARTQAQEALQKQRVSAGSPHGA